MCVCVFSTALSDVTKVRVTHRTETHLTIEWDKLNKDNIYNYTLKQSSGNEIPFTGSKEGDVISHELSQLKPGTVYDFTLYTVVNSNISSGTHFKNVTSKITYDLHDLFDLKGSYIDRSLTTITKPNQ